MHTNANSTIRLTLAGALTAAMVGTAAFGLASFGSVSSAKAGAHSLGSFELTQKLIQQWRQDRPSRRARQAEPSGPVAGSQRQLTTREIAELRGRDPQFGYETASLLLRMFGELFVDVVFRPPMEITQIDPPRLMTPQVDPVESVIDSLQHIVVLGGRGPVLEATPEGGCIPEYVRITDAIYFPGPGAIAPPGAQRVFINGTSFIIIPLPGTDTPIHIRAPVVLPGTDIPCRIGEGDPNSGGGGDGGH